MIFPVCLYSVFVSSLSLFFLILIVASVQKKKRFEQAAESTPVGAPVDPQSATAAANAIGSDGADISASAGARPSRLGKLKCAIDLLVVQLSIAVVAEKSKSTVGRSESKFGNISSSNNNNNAITGNRPHTAQDMRWSSFDRTSSHIGGTSALAASGSANPSSMEFHPVAALYAPVGFYHLAVFGRLMGVFPRPRASDRYVTAL